MGAAPGRVGPLAGIGLFAWAVPAAMLSCGGLPSAAALERDLSTAAIELSVDPRGVPMQDLPVDWVMDTAELVPMEPPGSAA